MSAPPPPGPTDDRGAPDEDRAFVDALRPPRLVDRVFAPRPALLWVRWVFLRALGGIFFSAFLPLAFEIQGMVGPRGILPARELLSELAPLGWTRYWQVPTALWLGASDGALVALWVVGMASSIALVLNLWPRAAIAAAGGAFLSFVSVASDFAAFQSDGMLLEAALAAFFFAPRGLRPGLGAASPPTRLATWALRLEWFLIYFESGVAKLASGDPSWRDMTAMDRYYENGPLPTWIGWWAHQLPQGVHAATAVATLLLELVVVWVPIFPSRRARVATFLCVTPFQIGIILTANYTFLNYLVLLLGVLWLDDRALSRVVPRLARREGRAAPPTPARAPEKIAQGVVLGWTFVVMATLFFFPWARWLPRFPIELTEPFRVANRYGLFAVMTPDRYEIEFQGSLDGRRFRPYAFRFKPQRLGAAPGIYAPYQPRFEWILWFASLGHPLDNPFVLRTQRQLLLGSKPVLSLFAADPFRGERPRFVRAERYQYWFTDRATRRRTGRWWRREWVDHYGPTLERLPSGRIRATWADE